jgi:putative DNA primase/helicase
MENTYTIDQDKLSPAYVDEYGNPIKKKTEKKGVDQYHRAAVRIKEGMAGNDYIYCMEADKFYIYSSGYWKEKNDIDMLGEIQEAIPDILKYTIYGREQIIKNLRYIVRQNIDKFNAEEVINLKNCMLTPRDGKTYAHSKEFFSTQRLDFNYEPEADCLLWKKTLNEIFENDQLKLDALQEFLGYCLTRETKYMMALLLLGESKTGKSTILSVIKALIGKENCSSVPLESLKDKQDTPQIINKLVNIDTEVSEKSLEFERPFKAITAGEAIQASQKYIPSFSFDPHCKLVLAANRFPRITDHSSAFYNRLLLIPCDRIFLPEEQDPDLPKKLLKELPGILNWSLIGLKRLFERNRFNKSEFMKEAIEELENDNNPVNLFFEEHIKIEMGTYIEKGDLFNYYKNWCVRTNTGTLNSSRFSSCLYKKYHRQTAKNAQLTDTHKRIWKNLKYIDNNGTQAEHLDWNE